MIRSGHHIPFEPDWFVDKKIDALKKGKIGGISIKAYILDSGCLRVDERLSDTTICNAAHV